MTIKGINTIDEPNGYLDTYLSFHNKRFAVTAKEQDNLRREIQRGLPLDKGHLYIRTVRTLRNDFTIAHDSKLYQIENGVRSKEVTVEERVNGSMLITLNDVRLPFREITARPGNSASQRVCTGTERGTLLQSIIRGTNGTASCSGKCGGRAKGQWWLPLENRTFLFCLDIVIKYY